MNKHSPDLPIRQIRANLNDYSINVYQAYSSAIALPALREQKFVPPFKETRMTWIKPSFLWMMYRSNWAQKPHQEHILQVELSREGFDWMLRNAVLTHFAPSNRVSHLQWENKRTMSPVLVQWDPERNLRLQPMTHRTIQIGLRNEAVQRYLHDWIIAIRDVTNWANAIRNEVENSQWTTAQALLPEEIAYPTDLNTIRNLNLG